MPIQMEYVLAKNVRLVLIVLSLKNMKIVMVYVEIARMFFFYSMLDTCQKEQMECSPEKKLDEFLNKYDCINNYNSDDGKILLKLLLGLFFKMQLIQLV